jgi:hypothetical protein
MQNGNMVKRSGSFASIGPGKSAFGAKKERKE